jgi:hypothetical protein
MGSRLAEGEEPGVSTPVRDNAAHALGFSRAHALDRVSLAAVRGRYNSARLMEKHGDAKLPDLRHVLANCPKAHAHSIHDRCKVRYGEDSRLS